MSVEDKDNKIIVKIGDDNANPRFEHAEFASTWKVYKMRIKESAYKVKGKTYIVLPESAQAGDIFYMKNHTHKFYIIRWKAYHPTGGQIYEIGRADHNRVSQFDLDVLVRKAWLQIRGYFNKNKCNK